MTLLNQSYYKPVTLHPKPLTVSLQQVENAPYWQVTETYQVSSIYMTAAQLASKLQDAVYSAAQQNKLKVLSFQILKTWAVWQGLWTNYYAQYQAVFAAATSSLQVEIPLSLVIVTLAVVAGIVIILFVYFVERVIVPLFNLVPTALKPAVATILLVALAVGGIGVGTYLVARALGKKRV
jgi:hypothetical protein